MSLQEVREQNIALVKQAALACFVETGIDKTTIRDIAHRALAGARTKQDMTYASAGVDIDAGNALVERIKPMARGRSVWAVWARSVALAACLICGRWVCVIRFW